MTYFNRLGVDTVRFNNFADHGGRHSSLILDPGEIKEVYKSLKWLHDTMSMRFQLALSEDFGTHGIEVMDFPSHVGWCRAGRQLFAAIPTAEVMIAEAGDVREEKIGDIVGCVNTFEPTFGTLVRITGPGDSTPRYRIGFDENAIDSFTADRMSGKYRNGCFAHELAEEMALTSRVPIRGRLPVPDRLDS